LGLDRNPKDEYLYQMMIQPHRSAQEDIKVELYFEIWSEGDFFLLKIEECEMK